MSTRIIPELSRRGRRSALRSQAAPQGCYRPSPAHKLDPPDRPKADPRRSEPHPLVRRDGGETRRLCATTGVSSWVCPRASIGLCVKGGNRRMVKANGQAQRQLEVCSTRKSNRVLPPSRCDHLTGAGHGQRCSCEHRRRRGPRVPSPRSPHRNTQVRPVFVRTLVPRGRSATVWPLGLRVDPSGRDVESAGHAVPATPGSGSRLGGAWVDGGTQLWDAKAAANVRACPIALPGHLRRPSGTASCAKTDPATALRGIGCRVGGQDQTAIQSLRRKGGQLNGSTARPPKQGYRTNRSSGALGQQDATCAAAELNLRATTLFERIGALVTVDQVLGPLCDVRVRANLCEGSLGEERGGKDGPCGPRCGGATPATTANAEMARAQTATTTVHASLAYICRHRSDRPRKASPQARPRSSNPSSTTGARGRRRRRLRARRGA